MISATLSRVFLCPHTRGNERVADNLRMRWLEPVVPTRRIEPTPTAYSPLQLSSLRIPAPIDGCACSCPHAWNFHQNRSFHPSVKRAFLVELRVETQSISRYSSLSPFGERSF